MKPTERSTHRVVVLGLAALTFVGAACRGSSSEDGEQQTGTELVQQAVGEGFTSVAIPATGTTAPNPLGSATQSGTSHTVSVGGVDIFGTSDSFRFVYETLPGDGTIIAKVNSVTLTNNFAKAGVMIREGLAADARNVAVMVPASSTTFRMQFRSAVAGTTVNSFTGGSTAPGGTGWVRLVRAGNNITGSYSTSTASTPPTTWSALGTVTMATTGAVYVGLATTSHAQGTATTAQYASVSITAPASGPPAPTGVTATPGNGQVTIGWNAVAGATSYNVQFRTSPTGTFSSAGTGITGTSFVHTGRTNGTTYYYVVNAVNANGTSANSTQVSATPTAPATPPGAPVGLAATPGNTQVSLSWNPSSGATSYTVKSRTSTSDPYTVLSSTVTGTSYVHAGLTNGTTYYYVVSAANSAGGSGDSAEVSATPTLPPPPPAPTGLTATAGNTQVSLSWGSVSTATSYTVKFRTTTTGAYAVLQEGLTSPGYTHTGLSNGTTYYYVVSATNAGGEGQDSLQANATPVAPPVATFTGTNVPTTLTPGGSWSESSGTHTVRGSGTDMYGTADQFFFAHRTVTGDVTITARVATLTSTNVWTKASVLIRDDLTAGSRNVATVVSPTATNKFRQQVRATTGGSTTSVASAANSAIPSWIRLQRVGNTFTSSHSSDGVNWTVVSTTTQTLNATARVGLGITSHTAGTLGTGTFTNVSVTLPAPPQAPAGLTGTPGNNQVHLTWNATANASSYTVKRSDTPGGPYTNVVSGVATESYTNTGLVNGQTYYFVVTATNSSGQSGNSNEASGTPVLLRPSVRTVSPADGATDVSPTAGVTLDLIMPNVGGGVDASTLNSSTVFLRKASDNSLVAANLNTSGGADVVVLVPTSALAAQTLYNFSLTDGLKDGTGAAFVPFSSSFTTGDAAPPPPPDVIFDKVSFPTTVVAARKYTSITIGPDNRLYAATVTGELVRFNMAADGGLSSPTVINTVKTGNAGADRAIIGLAWDPAATSTNLILWVTHGGAALTNAPDWTGKLSRLSGTTLGTYQDYVTNFPRSYKDHMTNSIAFKPGLNNVIWITQGSMNAMGAPDNAWGQRAEHLLAAAILRVDLSLITSPPLNVQTNDASPTTSGYNPFAANAPVTIYATGVRNAYDLMWHSNGELYTATNGSAAGGNTPATTSPLPSACSRRIDGTPYTSPTVPGITGNPVAEDDYLYRVVQGGYYGHPNPSRCEWVLNGGNPTSGVDNTEVAAYPVGTLPDRNWRGNVYNFGAHYSTNGMIEWRSNVFPQLVGRMMVVRYSNGDDILTLTVNPTTKGIVQNSGTVFTGMSGFNDPLDITHNVTTGHVYVTQHSGQTITLLRPRLN